MAMVGGWRGAFMELYEQMATARDLAVAELPPGTSETELLRHLDTAAARWAEAGLDELDSVESDELAEREAVLRKGEDALLEARRKLEDDLRDLDRKQDDADEVVARARATSDSDAAYRELGLVRQRLIKAQDGLTDKSKALLSLEAEAQRLRDKLTRARATERKLREDLTIAQRAAKKAQQRGDVRTRELTLKLELATEANEQTTELLQAEERKQRVLQQALSKELASRGGGEDGTLSTLDRRKFRSASAPATRSPPGHLDVVGTIQRNQSLLNELQSRRVENQRLRQDNAQLLLSAKDALTDADLLKAQVVTSVHDRAELLHRLDVSKNEAKQWQRQLQSTAEAMVRRHQVEKAAEEARRWDLLRSSETGSVRRPRNRAPAKYRNTQVARWADYSGGRLVSGKYER